MPTILLVIEPLKQLCFIKLFKQLCYIKFINIYWYLTVKTMEGEEETLAKNTALLLMFFVFVSNL